MDITLVICTRDRARRLADTLPHLARLHAGDSCEIIFVDNGSSDTTREVLSAFVGSSGMNARVVEEPTVGLSVARNTGWRQAAGDVIAFTDDDCYPSPDYVEQLRVCFGEADLSYLGGRVLLFDRNDFPITIKVSEVREELPPRSFLPAGVVHGANLAVRRDVLEIVGGFDERLGIGSRLESAEDIDLVARASAAGFHGAYDPRPVVFHHHRRSKPEDVKHLMAIYDIGRGAFYAKAVLDRRMRSSYFWPVLRRVGGNILRKEFSVMGREFYGAWNVHFRIAFLRKRCREYGSSSRCRVLTTQIERHANGCLRPCGGRRCCGGAEKYFFDSPRGRLDREFPGTLCCQPRQPVAAGRVL